jgi:hypothetical protein
MPRRRRRRGNRLGWITGAITVFILVAEVTGLGSDGDFAPGPSVPAGRSGFAVETVSGPVRAPALAPRVDLGGDRAQAGQRYTGTAFAIDRDRAWITALHVVDGCRRLVLNVRGGPVEVASVWEHRDADIALVMAVGSDGHGSGLETRADEALPFKRALDRGFAVGFPQGQPGSVAARFLGPVRVADSESGVAAGQIWAVDRYPLLPDDPNQIGGISGGPMLGSGGAIEGVIVGNAPRRARVVTVDADYIRDLVGAADAPPIPSDPVPVASVETVDRVNDRLRRDGRLSQVICDA